MIRYVDSSVVLRVLFAEAGAISLPAGMYSSKILEVEAARAVDRRRALGLLDAQERAAKVSELAAILSATTLAAITNDILLRASSRFQMPVRALDAIHVATAEALAQRDEIEFWTHDVRQAEAASSRGLEVRGA